MSLSKVGSTVVKPSTEKNNAPTALVHLENIGKSFPGVRALDGVTLSLFPGEVLSLVGENGAGKSTLMKILSGVYPHGTYEGEIRVAGKSAKFTGPKDAENAGIAIIHQELASFSDLSVAENLVVGHWPKILLGGFSIAIDWKRVESRCQHWLAQVGLNVAPDTPMRDLSVGEQQMVEIAKALSRESQVLILDEPTSALTPNEVQRLFELISQLRARGHGLIYISHKMDELFHLSDRMTVLRDGRTVATTPREQLTEKSLIAQMVGRTLDQQFPPRPKKQIGEVILRVKNFSAEQANGKKVFAPLSFEIKKGEILGLAGLLGAGRTELIRALYGDPTVKTDGERWIQGKIVPAIAPLDGLDSGISFVPEDRKRQSIFPNRSLDENISISRLMEKGLWSWIDSKTETRLNPMSLQSLRVKCSSSQQEIRSLSGGNQQKVILARALQTEPDILLLDEPTRGVDVGAKYEIYEILFQLASQGLSLIVVSSELPELMGLCDRIAVLAARKWMGEIQRESFSQSKIMELAVQH